MTTRHDFAATARLVVALFALSAMALVGTGASAQMGPQLSPRDMARLPKTSRDQDQWDAQDGLVGASLDRIPAPAADRVNAYAVAIAPLGTQTLFSREARTALAALAANYGGTAAAGVLLSNYAGDAEQAPMATQHNVARVLAGIGERTRASPDDVLIVYLTSHGSPDASLQSALSRNQPILAISADSLAVALDQAQIRRRVIIVSACFAGSWIPRLANDDTIIITAAAADRTSFGCANDRPLTYFGEAFLTGPLSHGASLHESFEGAKQTVTKWETDEKLLNSNPQVFVGKNMQAVWDAAPRGIATKASAPKAITATR